MRAAFVIAQGAGVNLPPRGKRHLSFSADAPEALCGKQPDCDWNTHGDRERFERHCPEKICKRCRNAEPHYRRLDADRGQS